MMLLIMILIPAVTAIVLAIIPSRFTSFHRNLAFMGSFLTLILGIILWFQYPLGHQGFPTGHSFSFNYPWLSGSLGATFSLGVDGISLVLADMSNLLYVLVVLFSWVHVKNRQKVYYILLMIMMATTLGVFFARDVLLFYFFWEIMLLPMYFLIGIWGGERRLYASIKFVLFTLSGSLLMLVSIVSLYVFHLEQFGFASMAMQDIYNVHIPVYIAPWLFLGFLLAFAIKTPLFPLHTWLPDAHVEAPSGGSVILAGIMLKVGIYGFIRLLIPIFPGLSGLWGGIICFLGVVGILYGGFIAWSQTDIKKLVAYSSVSHLGFVVLGLFALQPTSMTGGVLQGAIHGINTGALFLLVGMLYNRLHVRELKSVGGLATQMPLFSVFFVIVSFASIGLPATNGFVGEFTILVSSFSKYPILTVFATLGVVVSALYMLRLLRCCVFGEVSESVQGHPDLSGLEILTILPLIFMVFWIGLYPGPVIDRIEPSVNKILQDAEIVSINQQESPHWKRSKPNKNIKSGKDHS